MQQQRRIYAGEGRNSVVVAQSTPEGPSDDVSIVNFLLRNLPSQIQLMASLRENSEIVDVNIDIMEWVDVDYESEHHAASAVANSIIFHFPNFYKKLSLACDYLRSAVCAEQSARPMYSSQLRCSIKLPCSEMFFGSNSNVRERNLKTWSGRIASIQIEKQIVKSRVFSCSNENCRLFMKEVTHNVWFFDDLELPSPSECSSCGLSCMIEDISSCQVSEHQIWGLIFDQQTSTNSALCQVSVYEQILENPQVYLGCQVEMVTIHHFSLAQVFALPCINTFAQVVFPKRSQQSVVSQNCISWRFPMQFEPNLQPSTRADVFRTKAIDHQICCSSAQLAFDNIMSLHKHILPKWLSVGEVIRVALSSAVASCSQRFRNTSLSNRNDGSPLRILFRTDDQEPVMVIVQTILSQLCKIFEISFGVVYPSSICANRESKFKDELGGFATTLHLLRSGVVLIPQIQELFSDTKSNSSKIDILETIAEKVPVGQVPGTCIVGIWCEHGPESTKTKTSNQVRIEKLWDLNFSCKESAKTESLLGLLESTAIGLQDYSSDVFSRFAFEVQRKFASENDRIESLEDSSILLAYTQAVAMLTSAAAPAGFSIVKRECNSKHLNRILRAIQCANFEIANEGTCILACVHIFLMFKTLLIHCNSEFGSLKKVWPREVQ